ncbi:MAG: lytic murein transglycosylase [Hyphomonadaceae bacterium]
MKARTWKWATAGIVLGLVVAACETTKVAGSGPNPKPPGSATEASPPPAPEVVTPGGFASSGNSQFDMWRDEFALKSAFTGRKAETVRAVLDGLVPVEATAQAQSFDNQAEFVKPIWDYAKSAVSPTRITNGQAKLAANADAFTAIEAAYAPPREILAAVWGMESAYGAVIGNEDAPRVLASQAAVGRRKDFNEQELGAIMRLIDDGSATREQFRKASWAGAIGQTQFMPSSIIQYGKDFDGDGHKDLWANAGDALASAGNYLEAFGWKKGQPWAVEATIPAGFDYSYGDGRKYTVAAWKAIGITPVMPATFTDTDILSAELFLPAGSYGPAFLLFDNFYVIKKYNNADSYALAIGLLADRLAGRPDLTRPWPTDIQMLTQQQAKDLQTGLNTLGFAAGTVDGIIGRGTRGALQKFQKSKSLTADGFPTVAMLTAVQDAATEG